MDSNPVTLECQIKNTDELYRAYMPYILGGGLFVKTDPNFHLGDECYLNLYLLDEMNPFKLFCKVVWLTPKGAQGGKSYGVGLQFIDDNASKTRNHIETILAGSLQSSKSTDTI